MKWWAWLNSVRSWIALATTGLFVYLGAIGKIDPKDVIMIVVLVFNFYFLAKKREETGGTK